MPAGSIKAARDAAFAANLTSRLPDTPGDWLNTGVPQTVDAAFGTLAAGVATNSNSITAEVARSTAVDDAQSSQLAAQGKFYQTTAAAQADASLANGSVYQVPNTSTGQVDLYAKVSSSSSTFLMSLPGALQVNANTAAINTINETQVATAFLTEP